MRRWFGDERLRRTQRLDIVLVEAAFDVLDHETRLSYLRVSNHSNFDDDAGDGK